MIRAVVRNGAIQPLEALPAGWDDGREVVVDALEVDAGDGAATLQQWSTEMNALTAPLNDPAEWQQIEAMLAEADRQAKAQVRREMGLS